MYFQVVSTYIQLNPARAGLIRMGEQRLKAPPLEQLAPVSEAGRQIAGCRATLAGQWTK